MRPYRKKENVKEGGGAYLAEGLLLAVLRRRRLRGRLVLQRIRPRLLTFRVDRDAHLLLDFQELIRRMVVFLHLIFISIIRYCSKAIYFIIYYNIKFNLDKYI
jgi:hypothetical protein